MCIVPLVVFTRVAGKIACLHADLASTAITRETRKACVSELPCIRKKLPVAGSVDRSNDIQVRRRT